MLTELELSRYFDEHQLSQKARNYILRTRRDGPSRKVGEYANGNVTAHFHSEKMNGQISVESHTVELVFARMCEFDDSILEYYAQPAAIDIYAIDRKGRRKRQVYTSDFLILTIAGPRVVQTKPKQKLDQLVEKQPKNWIKDGDVYIHKPAREAFADLGLQHQVSHFDSWAPTLSANLGLILQARRLTGEELDRIDSLVDSAFASKAWMTLGELQSTMKQASMEPIFSLIREKRIHCLLSRQLLSQPDVALVSIESEYLDQAFAHVGNQSLVASDRESVVAIEHAPSPQQASEALKRLERLDDSTRTGRRLRRLVKEGKKIGLTPFQALIPQFHQRGNARQKIANEVKEFLLSFLDSNDYSDARDLSRVNTYALYREQASRSHPGLEPVSEKTFWAYEKGLDQVIHARRRKGRRGANAAKPPSNTSTRVIKNTVPFALAAIDHYNVDIAVVIGRENDRPVTARCWLSAMVDLATGDVLGWYISLHAPSRISCAMVIRDCIRRHGKVPAAIITDRGADFCSHYFSAMLSTLGIERRLRPASDPRYGSEVEQLFGTFKKERLNLLPGNIKGIGHDRSVSSSHSPHKNAVLTPLELITELDIWFEWRRTKLIGASFLTIEEKVDAKAASFDFVGQQATLDHATYVITAIDNKRYVVDPRRGIHTDDGLHYWHPDLGKVRGRTRVEVKKEPEDPYRIYALVDDKWVTCTNTEETVFQQKTSVSQRSEAMLFFTPHDIKKWRRQEARQRLITIQGSLTKDQPAAADLLHQVHAKSSTSRPPNPFDSVRPDSNDVPRLESWGDK